MQSCAETACQILFVINYYNFSGAIGFDKTDGFWLITSLPKFPSPKSDGYKFPSNGDVYGQTFLCISMNYDMLDIVGEFGANYKSYKVFNISNHCVHFSGGHFYFVKMKNKTYHTVRTVPKFH